MEYFPQSGNKFTQNILPSWLNPIFFFFCKYENVPCDPREQGPQYVWQSITGEGKEKRNETVTGMMS